MAAAGLRKSPLVSERFSPLRIPMVAISTPKRLIGVVRSWWTHSTLRKLAQEVGNFPRRILAIRQLPNWAHYRLPRTPDGLPPNSFLLSCSEHIQELRREFPWAGFLDAQILAKAYAEGARWAYGMRHSCNENGRES
jgi:hypothetical protein